MSEWQKKTAIIEGKRVEIVTRKIDTPAIRELRDYYRRRAGA